MQSLPLFVLVLPRCLRLRRHHRTVHESPPEKIHRPLNTFLNPPRISLTLLLRYYYYRHSYYHYSRPQPTHHHLQSTPREASIFPLLRSPPRRTRSSSTRTKPRPRSRLRRPASNPSARLSTRTLSKRLAWMRSKENRFEERRALSKMSCTTPRSPVRS